MTDAIAIAKELSTVGFPTLLVVILIGSYLNVWVWGKAHRELKVDYEARLAEEKAAKLQWQDMALRGVGLAEDLGNVRRMSK